MHNRESTSKEEYTTIHTVEEDKCFMRGGYMYNCRRIWYEYVQVCDGSRYTVLQYVGGDGTISYMYLNWCVCKSICTVLYKAIDF